METLRVASLVTLFIGGAAYVAISISSHHPEDAVEPNGTPIAVERLDDLKTDRVGRIYILTLPTGERVLLTTGAGGGTTLLPALHAGKR